MTQAKFNKPAVFTISIAHFIHDVYSSFLAPVLPLLIEKFGMSLFASAFLDLMRRIPALLNPFLGLLAEKTEARYFVILTPAITAISMSFIGLAAHYIVLCILIFVAGISAALFHIPSPVLIKEAAGDKIGTGMSWFMVGGEAARTMGPLLVTGAITLWGLDGVLSLLPLGLFASFILYKKLKNIDAKRPAKKNIDKGDSKKLLKKYRGLFVVLIAFILSQAAMKSAFTLYLPVYLTERGESLWYAGISLSVLQFFGVIGTFFAGSISDKIGRQNTLVLSSIGAVIGMALFLYSDSIYFLAIFGLFLFASGPVLMALVQDTNSDMPTFMNSIYMLINFGSTSIIVFAVGIAGDSLGLEKTYMICNIVALGTIPAALLIDRFSQQQPSSTH